MASGLGESFVRTVAFTLITILLSATVYMFKLEYEHLNKRLESTESRLDEAARQRMENIERDTLMMSEQRQQRTASDNMAKEMKVLAETSWAARDARAEMTMKMNLLEKDLNTIKTQQVNIEALLRSIESRLPQKDYPMR